MADESELTKALFEALPTVGDIPGWEAAPVIDCWSLTASPNEREVAVIGTVSGSEKFPNGNTIRTSALRTADVSRRFVKTQNSTYRLGWPARASLDAEAEHVWPPALSVAACSNWFVACMRARNYTGKDTISEGALTALTAASHDDGDWAERRSACRSIAQELSRSGRAEVAEAWWVLATNLTVAKDRIPSAIFVDAAAGLAERTYDREVTADEAVSAVGWRLISTIDDAQVDKLSRDGVPTHDPIAGARKVALISMRVARSAGGSVSNDALENVGVAHELKDADLKNPGVVVLQEVGGADNPWTRAAQHALKPIVGVKLPLTPLPDLAVVQRALVAEFPYARQQIDVVLSDLVAATHVQLRPTLVVGPSGNGKSRFCRRLELLGLHVTRNDCASDDDNSFGGTPRRWSSGEPSVPVRAMLAAKRADGLIVLDELDKTGVSRNHGRMQDVLLSYLEKETAARVVDPYVQSPVDCSYLSFVATANDPMQLDTPLRDRFRILRIPSPTSEDLPALCRGILADLVRESGMAREWMRDLDASEIDYVAAKLWRGGSVRRLREIVVRIIAKRADMPKH